MSRIVLLIGVGGFIGSIARYWLSSFFSKILLPVFPFGTFIVNILGCLLIGIVYGIAARYSWLAHEWRLFLTVGICGGFTTFSAFAYENVALLHNGNISGALLNVTLSTVLGTLAVWAGMLLVKI